MPRATYPRQGRAGLPISSQEKGEHSQGQLTAVTAKSRSPTLTAIFLFLRPFTLLRGQLIQGIGAFSL